MPPASLIFLTAVSMPSLWYWPGLPSLPVIGSTTPIEMASSAAAARAGINPAEPANSRPATAKRSTFLHDIKRFLMSVSPKKRAKVLNRVLNRAETAKIEHFGNAASYLRELKTDKSLLILFGEQFRHKTTLSPLSGSRRGRVSVRLLSAARRRQIRPARGRTRGAPLQGSAR